MVNQIYSLLFYNFLLHFLRYYVERYCWKCAVVTCVSVLLFVSNLIWTGQNFTKLVQNADHGNVTKATQLSPMTTATTDEIKSVSGKNC